MDHQKTLSGIIDSFFVNLGFIPTPTVEKESESLN